MLGARPAFSPGRDPTACFMLASGCARLHWLCQHLCSTRSALSTRSAHSVRISRVFSQFLLLLFPLPLHGKLKCVCCLMSPTMRIGADDDHQITVTHYGFTLMRIMMAESKGLSPISVSPQYVTHIGHMPVVHLAVLCSVWAACAPQPTSKHMD